MMIGKFILIMNSLGLAKKFTLLKVLAHEVHQNECNWFENFIRAFEQIQVSFYFIYLFIFGLMLNFCGKTI